MAEMQEAMDRQKAEDEKRIREAEKSREMMDAAKTQRTRQEGKS